MFFHLSEIGGIIMDFGGFIANKLRAVFYMQCGAESTLISKRRKFTRRHPRTSNRPGSMGRVQQNMIAKREDLLKNTVVEQAGNLCSALGIKVGASDIADKQCVTGEDRHRLFTEFQIAEHQRDAFIRVSGGFENSQREFAEFKDLPFGNGITVFEGKISAVIDRRTGLLHEFARADHKIFVAV